MKRLTRKQIEAMPYGSPAQIEAADMWMQHMMSLWLRTFEYELAQKNGTADGTEIVPADWWVVVIENALRKAQLEDVWYLARQRWNHVTRGVLTI
jgi:hypothetical protein